MIMNEACDDNRFEIIARAKAHILESTNIDTREDEMKCLDNFLFRCWQMGWLKQYESTPEIPNNWIPVSEGSPEKSGNYWCTFGGTYLTGTDYYTTESDAKKLFDDPEEYAGWQSHNVTAWMPLQNVIPWIPLPEPYKAESEG